MIGYILPVLAVKAEVVIENIAVKKIFVIFPLYKIIAAVDYFSFKIHRLGIVHCEVF